jgi:hypothetical protein
MNFSAVFKARYDALWNTAVKADTALTTGYYNGDSMSATDYSLFLTQYADTTRSIVSNLRRQWDRYEDKDAVSQYMNETIEETYSDFQRYKDIIKTRLGTGVAAQKCLSLIDSTLQEYENHELDDSSELSASCSSNSLRC